MIVAGARRVGGDGLSLVRHQFRYDLLSFRRNPQARFFTIALPVIFLVIFASVFGSGTVRVDHRQVAGATYFVPRLVALGIVSASLVNLVISVTTQRETGVLKRRRATPVPAWVLIVARSLVAGWVSLVMVVVLVAIGSIAYGVKIPGHTIPAVVVTVLVSSLSLCGVGWALVTFIRSADAAQPVTQAIILPLYFISGVFFPDGNLPQGLRTVSDFFPIRHVAAALAHAFDPLTSGSGFAARDLLVVLAWGVAGLIVALRRFSWAPRGT